MAIKPKPKPKPKPPTMAELRAEVKSGTKPSKEDKPTRITREVEIKFLNDLYLNCRTSHAAEICGCSLAAFYQRRTRNPAFAAEWDKVNELIKFQLEEEAYRRGVLGYEEPVYYQGVKCGSITKYSDSLLRFRLKAEMPEKYNPIHKLTVDVSSSDGSMIPRATQLTNEVEVAKLIDMFETSLRLIKEQMEKNDRQAEKKRNLGSKKKTV